MPTLTYVSKMPVFVTNFINISGRCGVLLLIDIDFFKKGQRKAERKA